MFTFANFSHFMIDVNMMNISDISYFDLGAAVRSREQLEVFIYVTCITKNWGMFSEHLTRGTVKLINPSILNSQFHTKYFIIWSSIVIYWNFYIFLCYILFKKFNCFSNIFFYFATKRKSSPRRCISNLLWKYSNKLHEENFPKFEHKLSAEISCCIKWNPWRLNVFVSLFRFN
jgi:hypothetical protein